MILAVFFALLFVTPQAAQLHAQVVRNATAQFRADTSALAKFGDPCGCHFAGWCTCESALEFMNCIAAACRSQACDCQDRYHFMTACGKMAAACPAVGLRCSEDESTCLAPRHNRETYALDDDGVMETETVHGSREPAPRFQPETRVAPLAVPEEAKWMPTWRMPRTPRVEIDLDQYSFRSGWGISIGASIVDIIVLLVAAFLYDRVRVKRDPFRAVGGAAGDPSPGFSHGLCQCYQEPKLSLFACCCWSLRWAHTLDVARNKHDVGTFRYWFAVAFTCVMMFLYAALPLCGLVFVALAVYNRQLLRKRFQLPKHPCSMLEDCFVWLCCPCCAVVQEARQVDTLVVSRY